MTRRGGGMAAAGVLAVFAASILVVAWPPGDEPPVVQADAAIVLSGDVDYLRVKHAIGLVTTGQVKALLLTGRGVGGDSAEEMRRQAIAVGVPADAIVLETMSTSTP